MAAQDGIIELMSEKIREISISEFFEKNRHLLGYENPTKSLLTVVKEIVDNSLTWETPIILLKNDKIVIEPIGKFIDEQFRKYKNLKFCEGESLEKLKIFDEAYAFSFNPQNMKIELRRVSTLFRHKVNSKIFEIVLGGGRKIQITDYHSIFALRKGEVICLKGSEVKNGDYILVPSKIPEILTDKSLIDLSSILTRYVEKKRLRIFGIRRFLNRYIEKLKKILPKNKRYRIQDFKKLDSMPFDLAEKIGLIDEYKPFLRIGLKVSRHSVPLLIKPSIELARLLGIFTAEGSILHNLNRIYISFNPNEKDIAEYTAKIIKIVFGENCKIKKAHKTAINVKIDSKILSIIFKYVFGFRKAREKRIPWIVFLFPNKLKWEYLLFYAIGDGYPTKILWNIVNGKEEELERIILTTSSKGLAIDLQYLLSFLGFSYSITEKREKKRIIKGKVAKFGKNYIIYFYLKQKIASLNKIPIDSILDFNSKLLEKRASRQEFLLFQTIKDNLNSLLITPEVKAMIEGDIAVLKVKKVKEIPYKHKWVYDISVPEYENFIAGWGPIFSHNSVDACVEAGILPTIKVKVKSVGENIYKVRVEDNGPGLHPEKIPLAFGKFLVGSKFYRLRQSFGSQGIGAKGAILYSQLTTGKPTTISTIYKGKLYEFQLMIDVLKNEPNVISKASKEIDSKKSGLTVEMLVEGRYIEKGQSIPTYLRYVWIANPYVEIIYEGPNDDNFKLERIAKELPKQPKEIKPHPYGVELGKLKRMIALSEKKSLIRFLTTEFSRVGADSAKKICKIARLNPERVVNTLTDEEIGKLHKAMQSVKLMSPPTDCLSPLKNEFIEESLKREFNPEFVKAVTRKPSVYRGNPFQIQAAIAYGGDLVQKIGNENFALLLRFANHTPLLYNQSDCVITRAVEEVDWRNYKLEQQKSGFPIGPVVILVDVLSVWIPYKSEGKQAIAEYPEILKEIKLALQEAGRNLGNYLSRKIKLYEMRTRKNVLEAYSKAFSEYLSPLIDVDEKVILEKIKYLIEKGKYKEVEEKKEEIREVVEEIKLENE